MKPMFPTEARERLMKIDGPKCFCVVECSIRATCDGLSIETYVARLSRGNGLPDINDFHLKDLRAYVELAESQAAATPTEPADLAAMLDAAGDALEVAERPARHDGGEV